MVRHTMTFDAIGTRWQIDTDRKLPPCTVDRVLARGESFDATYSRFRPESLVSGLARGAGEVTFPDDALALFALYRKLYDATDGTVTPLVGRVLEHLGYDSSYSLRPAPGGTTVPDWDEVLRIDGTAVNTTEPVTLDFGAAGKGYLVDLVAEILLQAGFDAYLIDASGDMIHRGREAERVGLEDPHQSGRVIGYVNLSNNALCASSTTRRRWGDNLHHVIDPRTAQPTGEISATWVLSSTCAVADGLATALFLAEPEQLSSHFEFSYVRLPTSGGAEWSSNLDGQVFG